MPRKRIAEARQLVTAHFRLPPIRSKAYLRAARDQPCSIGIPGVCTGNTETTVGAHIRDEHTGRGVKASDISLCDACAACHAALDFQSGVNLSKEEWLYYALRGMQRTLENRIHRGIISIPLDEPTPARDKPVKPRKPREQRAKINTGSTNWPTRKLQSRNDLRKER